MEGWTGRTRNLGVYPHGNSVSPPPLQLGARRQAFDGFEHPSCMLVGRNLVSQCPPAQRSRSRRFPNSPCGAEHMLLSVVEVEGELSSVVEGEC